jgi:hypothetical protein
LLTVLLSVASLTAATFIYNAYSAYAQSIDQQIAGGYLRGHAGLYAAPRVIEKRRPSFKGTARHLTTAGGLWPKHASNIWSGSFEVKGDQIRIAPRQGTTTYEWIDVTLVIAERSRRYRPAKLTTSRRTLLNQSC